MSGEAVIEVEGLRSTFGAEVVHDGVDLQVRRGEILGVIGASGAGKSVLLRTIVGLRRPQAGRVRLLGQDLAELELEATRGRSRRFGLMFQDGALFSSLTVQENVALPLCEYYRLPRDLIDELARLKVALAQLPADCLQKYPSQLSGGMRKRAGLARALCLDPELLLLDEPTSGLDPIAAAAVDELIATLKNALGLTVFLVTHDLDSVYAICDRVAVLADGRIVAVDAPAVVEQAPHPWIQECFRGPRARGARRGPAPGGGAKGGQAKWKPEPTTS